MLQTVLRHRTAARREHREFHAKLLSLQVPGACAPRLREMADPLISQGTVCCSATQPAQAKSGCPEANLWPPDILRSSGRDAGPSLEAIATPSTVEVFASSGSVS